jgi:hypothetical protein
MSRTFNTRAGKQSVPNVYEIIRQADGTFDIFHNGELTSRSTPDEWLEDELAKYGICGHEFRDARRQLDDFGKVKLEFGSGWMETKLIESRLKTQLKGSRRLKGN